MSKKVTVIPAWDGKPYVPQQETAPEVVAAPEPSTSDKKPMSREFMFKALLLLLARKNERELDGTDKL